MHTHYHTRNTLLKRAKAQNDEQAWQEVVDLYKPYIYVIIRSQNVSAADADDLLQQVLIALWKYLPDYNYYPEKAKFRTWLNKITRNQVISHFRKIQSNQNKVDQLEADTSTPNDSEAHESMFQQEWELFLSNTAMKNIEEYFSPNAIEAFQRFLKGQGVQEISDELGVKRDSTYKYISRIKAKLIEEIQHLKQEMDF